MCLRGSRLGVVGGSGVLKGSKGAPVTLPVKGASVTGLRFVEVSGLLGRLTL